MSQRESRRRKQRAHPEFTERLRTLLRERRMPDGSPVRLIDIAIASGGRLQDSHLSSLASGRISNPTYDTLLELCRFFRVPPAYFFPQLDHIGGDQHTPEGSS